MVLLATANASNARIATSLPAGMVAVFVGATSGIGEYTLKAFAQHTNRPRIYVVGRSESAAKRIIPECEQLNPRGTYHFIQSDVSLLSNVDRVCEQILAKEDSINLLFQTQGTMVAAKTSEGLPMTYVLPVTSRILFALNLLPALRKAQSLKRVVSVFAAGKEGPFDHTQWTEFAGKNLFKSRPHIASMITMANNKLSQQAPDVSFIHDFPSGVKTSFGREMKGPLMSVARVLFNTLGPLFIHYISAEECGARQLYLATSARFPPRVGGGSADGVPIQDGASVGVARGTNGQLGSGSYTINYDGENVALDVDKHLEKARADGMEENLWAHILREIEQATGKARG